MIEQGLFKRHFVGRDGFIWWIGQVAPEESWDKNAPPQPQDDTTSIAGFGERCKVRIMGYHTADPGELPDDDLPWASQMYPVTAGGGSGSWESSGLRGGTFVFGFFLDGEDAQVPVIMGCIGYNQFQQVPNWTSNSRFVPANALREYTADQRVPTVPVTALKNTPGNETRSVSQGGGNDTAKLINQDVGENVATQEQVGAIEKAERNKPIPQSRHCEPVPLGKIQKGIVSAIAKVEKSKRDINRFNAQIQSGLVEFRGNADEAIKKATTIEIEGEAEDIVGAIKWVINQLEEHVIRLITLAAAKGYDILYPSDQSKLKDTVDTGLELLACLFKKIIAMLLDMVKNILLDAVNRLVNAAECFIENLIGGILGRISDMIQDTLDYVMGLISSIVGQAVSIGTSVLGLITKILSFLTCDEKPDCMTSTEWSQYNGLKPITKSDIDSIISKAEAFAGTITSAIDTENLPDYSIDFDEIMDDANACFTGAIWCGAPIAQFWGGNGWGAAGNLIIGATGHVMGIDMTSFGVGFDQDTARGNVLDECGIGNGAVITPIVGDYIDDNGDTQSGVTGVVVYDPGSGYISTPNGSQGGDGRVWSYPDYTVVTHPDGSNEIPIPPGYVVPVGPGDIVTVPPGTEVPTSTGEVISGDHVIVDGGTFTTPEFDYSTPPSTSPPSTSPTSPLSTSLSSITSSDDSYSVILYICGIEIENPGQNYKEGDKVVIEPNNGAVLEAKYDSFGRVESVKIVSSGEGFKEFPRIYIESDTGFNAILKPRFCVDKIEKGKVKSPAVMENVITVVDCVGKHPFKNMNNECHSCK